MFGVLKRRNNILSLVVWIEGAASFMVVGVVVWCFEDGGW